MANKGLMFVVSANIKDFQAKMNQVQKDLNKMARQAQRGFGPIMDKIGGAAKLMGGLAAAGFGAATFAGMKLNAELEQSEIAFTTMLGSAEKADAFLQQMRDFARKTPFEFNELQGAAKKMLAFGFSAEQVEPMLTAVGDAVAGLGGGQELIDRVTLALGQMQAKGKVSGEEMRQLAEAGIPAWQMLADKFGLTTAEVMKLSEKGLIPAGEAIEALVTGIESRFAGMMEKQSKSWLGLWSTLKDTASIFITDVIEPTFEQAKAKFSEFMERLDAWRDSGQLQKWAEQAQAAFQRFWAVASQVVNGLIAGGKFIADYWGAIGPVLAGILGGFLAFRTAIAVIEGVTIAMATLNAVMDANPVALIVLGVAGLTAAGVALYRNWETVSSKLHYIWAKLSANAEIFFGRAIQSVLGGVLRAMEAVGLGASGMADAIRHDLGVVAEQVALGKARLHVANVERLMDLRRLAMASHESTQVVTGAAAHQAEVLAALRTGQEQVRAALSQTAGGMNRLRLDTDQATLSLGKQAEQIEDLRAKLLGMAGAAQAAFRSALTPALGAVQRGIITYGGAKEYAASTLSEEQLGALWEGMKKTYYAAPMGRLQEMFRHQYGVTPPVLHDGGIFRAPVAGGEGLAILRDQERVLAPGQSGGVVIDKLEINTYGVTEPEKVARMVDERIRHTFADLARQGAF